MQSCLFSSIKRMRLNFLTVYIEEEILLQIVITPSENAMCAGCGYMEEMN